MNELEKAIVHRLGICAVCTSCGGHTNCDGKQGSCVKEAADLIVRQSAEIDRIAQENEELWNQVYNLTLYLEDALDTLAAFYDVPAHDMVLQYAKDFSGMPGYNPAILEGNKNV